jgi:queuine tRNA-ribosyltransferase
VKGLTPPMVQSCGAQIILGNTYHLTLRPGDELIRDLGGLHTFMNWPGPILTDSGGYQVFSLAEQRKITDHGAKFKSHIDGSMLELTPEKAVEIQQNLGSDIAMVLDECPPADGDPAVIRNAVRRSILWAERCKRHHTRADQAQFAIVQGGLDVSLREECAAALVPMDFPGYALGGFSVGEAPEKMHAALPACAALLPAEKPRYLMGVGRPEDLILAVAKHRRDPAPLASDCECDCCANYSRAYLHHLFAADEMLGPILLSLHNIAFYLKLMRDARAAIMEGRYAEFASGALAANSHLNHVALPGVPHRSKMRVPIFLPRPHP